VAAARRHAEHVADEFASREAARAAVDSGAGRDPRVDRDKVLVGKDGWLFLQNDSNDVVGQYTGRVGLSRRQRRGWASTLTARCELASELGFTWLCSIVPYKEVVCAEDLPDHVEPAGRRIVDDILELAAAVDAPVTYPLDALRGARAAARPPAYCRTTTHWTQVGALAFYREACRVLGGAGIGVPVVADDSIRWRMFTTAGDLGSKLEPAAKAETVRPVIDAQRSRLVFDNRVVNHGRVMVFERADGSGPTALITGQSSTNYLLAFLKESFRRLVFVHTDTIPREIVERERPDVVLTCPGERFMVRVPDDSNGMAEIVEAIRIKRERGAARAKVPPYFRGIPGAGEVSNEFELPWRLG
jgi:hypothetical protein